MINPGLNSVITNTLHSTYHRKEISSDTSLDIYPDSDTSDESWEEYNKRRIKEDEQEAKTLFYIVLIGFIGVITCFILSIIWHI